MNVLLDTHVALWAITDSPQLSLKARDILLASRTHLWVSTASPWELAIKHRRHARLMRKALGNFGKPATASSRSSLSSR